MSKRTSLVNRTLLASTVPLMLLGACGGSSNDDAAADATVSLAEVPAAYASVFCDLTARCNPFFEAFIPEGECEVFFINTLNAQGFDEIVDAVEDERAVYNGGKMQECLDELSARSCDELGDPDPESCDQAATGTVERGGDCTTDIECEGDSICHFADSCPGTCSAKLNAGEACSGDDQCKDGLDCSDDTQRCVAPAQEGDECEGGVAPPCASDSLFCLGDDEEEDTPGTCRAVADVFTGEPGDECNFDDGPLCREGAACVIMDLDPATGEIALECVEVVDEGEDCRFGAPNPCEAGSYCADISLAALDFEGTCEPYAEPGDDCDPAVLLMCGLGAVCVPNDSGARCVARKDNGVACEVDDECWSENCVDGGCAPESACSE